MSRNPPRPVFLARGNEVADEHAKSVIHLRFLWVAAGVALCGPACVGAKGLAPLSGLT